MTDVSHAILDRFQVRKTKKQKSAFREFIFRELSDAGYSPVVEKGPFAQNVVVGDPEQAELLLTAHYDTQAVLPMPNFITPRNLFWYLLYQLLLVGVMFLFSGVVEAAALLLFHPPMEAAIQIFGAALLFCCWWLIDGPANKHTVNDNTSGVLTLMETALALPAEDRSKACFVFFDSEEKGMLGSSAFSRKHKQVKKDKLVVNFDCVSDGSSIQLFPSKRLKKDGAMMARLENAFQSTADLQVEVVRGFGFYPSDNALFRVSAGVCALRTHKVFGWYLSRIHTWRDTVLDEQNITLLRDGALRLLAADEAGRSSEKNLTQGEIKPC